MGEVYKDCDPTCEAQRGPEGAGGGTKDLKDYATLLRKIDRNDDATSLEARAEAILKKQPLKVQGK